MSREQSRLKEILRMQREKESRCEPICGMALPFRSEVLLHVTVRSAWGWSTLVQTRFSNTGLDVKLIIQRELGLPASLQLLFYGGKELEDSHILSERGVEQSSEMRILTCLREDILTALETAVKEEEAFEIAVLMRPFKYVVVKTSPRQSIRCIKRSIAEATGVPVAQQTLRFNDENLGDDKTVSFYRLHYGCVVYFNIN